MRFIALFILFVSPLCLAKIELEKIVKDDWIEVKTDNFIVVTDMKPKKARQLANDLEQFRYFITVTLGKQLVSEKPLEVLAVSSRKNFKRLDLPEFWAGVFQSGISGDMAIANVSDYSSSAKNKSWGNQVLMHEYVHFAARSIANGSIYPLWYNEGVAEYLATFRMEDNGKSVTIGSMDVIGNRLYALRNRIGTEYEKIDVEDLFKTKRINMSWRRHESGKKKREDSKAADKFYARAMITYHFLQSNKELGRRLGEYLNYINQGKSVDEAFTRGFNATYKEMDEAIHEYISGRYVRYIKLDVAKLGIDLPTVEPEIKELDSAQMYVYLARSLLRFSSYSLAEKDEILQLAERNNPTSIPLKLAGVDYLVDSNYAPKLDLSEEALAGLSKDMLALYEENARLIAPLTKEQADKQLADLAIKHPNEANIYSLQAYHRLDWVQNLLKVGHPNATQEFITLRNLARKAIRLDPNNGRAYYVLGMAGANSAESRPQFVTEAADSLLFARNYIGVSSVAGDLWKEVNLNMLRGDANQVLALSRKYQVLNDGKWITTGYGRFYVEAHEIRVIPFGATRRVTQSRIDYKDGSYYEGEIKDNLPHGKGVLTPYFGGLQQGVWRGGFVEGAGKIKTSNGFEYTGNFETGLLTGTGKMLWPEGSNIIKTEGEFLMGMEHGKHQYYWADGRVFIGENWLGRFHGELEIEKDGEVLNSFNVYMGSIQVPISDNLIFAGGINTDNQAHGKGTCYNKLENKVWPCKAKDGALEASTNAINITL
ncbi:hypothetical protein [Saccharophagus degradans]|uniref:Uncharacterized protein n=1 Tax=Saccharophagus degradans TaxID=86304 RepID=A0AAW7X4R5_9GAMM|nr:hypothetical protein [Saccharophagus degradans]MDO6422315.1 hypothetical protein [Saccharophagus degradans]MDO6608145.1 hypothetical protein [Saccharophagus degradans]